MLYLKSTLIGLLTLFVAFLLVTIRIGYVAGAARTALGAGAWAAYTIHSWMFWIIMVNALSFGFFYSLYFSQG